MQERRARPRLRELGAISAGVLVLVAGLVAVQSRAAADEPPGSQPTAGDLRTLARDPALLGRLEAGERLVWPGPAHRPCLVLALGKHQLLLERGLRDMDPVVSIHREGAFLVVEGPGTLRHEQDHEGVRRFDVSARLGLPWGPSPAPAPAPAGGTPPAEDSRLQMVEGDASIVRGGGAQPAPESTVSVNRGEQAPLLERDDAKLGEFAEGKVEVGGSKLTLLEHTSLRVVSIGEASSVVEVLGVRLEMKRGSVIEAAFGSLVLNLIQGELAVSPGSAGGELPTIKIVNVDPGTGIVTTTTVKLEPGQQLGVGPTGAWTTPESSSKVSIEVTLSVPVYDEQGNEVGRETLTSYQGEAPQGTAPPVPVLVDAIARVIATAAPEQLGPLLDAIANGVSVTDLGLANLATTYTGDPALVEAMQGVISQLGTGGDDAGPDQGVQVYFFGSFTTSSSTAVSANDVGNTPQSIETEVSQNSSGGSTGTVSPASTAAFLR